MKMLWSGLDERDERVFWMTASFRGGQVVRKVDAGLGHGSFRGTGGGTAGIDSRAARWPDTGVGRAVANGLGFGGGELVRIWRDG